MIEAVGLGITLIGGLGSGLFFIWRITSDLKVTLNDLNGSTKQLTRELNNISAEHGNLVKRVNRHDKQIHLLNHVIGIKDDDE